jgi:hypothetical protein
LRFKILSSFFFLFLWLFLSPIFGAEDEALFSKGKGAVAIDFFDEKGALLCKGSGFIISDQGEITTVASLFKKALRVEVITPGGKHLPIRGICGENRKKGLLKLKIEPEPGFSPVLISKKDVPVGAEVYIPDPRVKNEKVLKGKVVSLSEETLKCDFFAVLPSDFIGLPLFNSEDKAVGVITRVTRSSFIYGLPLCQDIAFEGYEPLSISDWNIKKEREWKESPEGLYHAVFSLIGQKRYEEALPLIEKLIKKLPHDQDAFSKKAYCLGKLKRYQEAAEVYQKLITLNPDNPSFYYNLGNARACLGKYEEAIQAGSEAIKLKPDYALAHYNLGICYLLTGKKAQADCEYEVLKKLDKRLAESLKEAERSYQESGVRGKEN